MSQSLHISFFLCILARSRWYVNHLWSTEQRSVMGRNANKRISTWGYKRAYGNIIMRK